MVTRSKAFSTIVEKSVGYPPRGGYVTVLLWYLKRETRTEKRAHCIPFPLELRIRDGWIVDGRKNSEFFGVSKSSNAKHTEPLINLAEAEACLQKQ